MHAEHFMRVDEVPALTVEQHAQYELLRARAEQRKQPLFRAKL